VIFLEAISKIHLTPNYPPEYFGGLLTSSKITAHPPEFFGGLRFFASPAIAF
jgi:hypothetical protein